MKKRDRKAVKKDKKIKIACDNLHKFYDGREMILNSFKSGIFPTKFKGSGILNTDNPKLRILTPKQIKLFILCISQRKLLKIYPIT